MVTGSPGAVRQPRIGYSWGPLSTNILNQVPYIDNNNKVSLVKNAMFVKDGGLRIDGWLWKMVLDVEVRQPAGQFDALNYRERTAILWDILKVLQKQRITSVADRLWECWNGKTIKLGSNVNQD
jgi:hypothetical protein